MFETMQSFLFFFIPTLSLIICGIIFEEHLVKFEQKIKNALFGGAKTKNINKSSKNNVTLSAVSKGKPQQSRRSKNKAA